MYRIIENIPEKASVGLFSTFRHGASRAQAAAPPPCLGSFSLLDLKLELESSFNTSRTQPGVLFFEQIFSGLGGMIVGKPIGGLFYR